MNQSLYIHSKMVCENVPFVKKEKSCLDIVLENQMAALDIQKQKLIDSLDEHEDSGFRCLQYSQKSLGILPPRRFDSNTVKLSPGSFVENHRKLMNVEN